MSLHDLVGSAIVSSKKDRDFLLKCEAFVCRQDTTTAGLTMQFHTNTSVYKLLEERDNFYISHITWQCPSLSRWEINSYLVNESVHSQTVVFE